MQAYCTLSGKCSSIGAPKSRATLLCSIGVMVVRARMVFLKRLADRRHPSMHPKRTVRSSTCFSFGMYSSSSGLGQRTTCGRVIKYVKLYNCIGCSWYQREFGKKYELPLIVAVDSRGVRCQDDLLSAPLAN